MKKYIKNGNIKYSNQIVLYKTKVIKDANGEELELKSQIINPTKSLLLKNGWEEYFENTVLEEDLNSQKAQIEIEKLKKQLSQSDYKVIKCMEAFLSKKEMPYAIDSLIEERELKRFQINELEQKCYSV